MKPEIAPLFSFMTNLACKQTRFKELIRGKMEDVLDKFQKILAALQYKGENIKLVLMVLPLISNLCTDADIRDFIARNSFGLLEHVVQQTAIMLKEKPLGYYKRQIYRG